MSDAKNHFRTVTISMLAKALVADIERMMEARCNDNEPIEDDNRDHRKDLESADE